MLANVIQHEADSIRPKPYEMVVIDEHGAGCDFQGRGDGDAAQRMRENEERRKISMERRITSADVLGVGGAKRRQGAWTSSGKFLARAYFIVHLR